MTQCGSQICPLAFPSGVANSAGSLSLLPDGLKLFLSVPSGSFLLPAESCVLSTFKGPFRVAGGGRAQRCLWGQPGPVTLRAAGSWVVGYPFLSQDNLQGLL
jgi:hypothetical protein